MAESMVIASVARAHPNLDFIVSKSGPEVTKVEVPLTRKPVPAPFSPRTLLLPKVTRTLSLVAMLASVLWCQYQTHPGPRSSRGFH